MRFARGGRLGGLSGLVIAVTVAAFGAGLAVLIGLANADVTTSSYTIGTPTPPVSSVVASPAAVGVVNSESFEVSFTVGTGLSGSAGDSVTVVPSTSLGSTPTNISLIASSCLQAGTNGGSSSATGVTILLDGSCSAGAGTTVEVDFTADAPFVTGDFSFAVITSQNDTPARSNDITVTPAGPVLTAASQAFGANTTYTISNAPVTGLTAAETSLSLTAAPTTGAETIGFVNGAAGYAVTVTPPVGSATSDAVDAAASSGATVTLTLASGLVDGDTLEITAPGQNPASSASVEADHVTVGPGNGSPATTNSIDFGGSLTDLSVTPASPLATAPTTYTVDFDATDAVASGGHIYLTESAGPTNFSTATGIEVADSTQNWHFIATGAILAGGFATIPLQDAISPGDSLSVTLDNVTNPPSAGTINDFTVASTADPVAATAPPYAIAANGSPGVLVTVDPSETNVAATYTLSNIFASGTLTGGAGTIKLEAPAGTVFPTDHSFYTIQDATTASGSGTVAAAVSGGGTNDVTFTVPNNINAGDALTLIVSGVGNPGTSSPTDAITLVGAVTGPPPTAVTTTTSTTPTTTAPTTTTATTITPTTTTSATTTTATTTKSTPTATKTTRGTPVVRGLSKRAVVHRRTIDLKARCSVAACKGTVTLTHGKTAVAKVKYAIRAGKTATIALRLSQKAIRQLATAKHHTITVTATISVTGGKTVRTKLNLVG